MLDRLRKRSLILIKRGALASILGLGFVCSSSLVAGDESQALQRCVQHLQDWRGSFSTVRVAWHSWNRKDFTEANPGLDPEKVLGTTHYSEYEFLWADWGAVRKELKIIKDERIVYRDSQGTEGTRPWSAETTYGKNPDVIDLIQYYRPDTSRPLSSNIAFNAVYGLWNSSGFWLDERLAGGEASVIKSDDHVDGIPCVLVSFKTAISEELIWLDPAASFLPRKIRLSQDAPHRGGRVVFYTWIASKIEKTDGGPLWPTVGQLWEGDKTEGFEWTVKKLTFNETLSRKDFAPPAGTHGITKVIDYLNGTTSRVGSSNNSGDHSKEPSTNKGNRVEAIPGSTQWRWLIAISLTLVVFGIVVKWIRARRV